MAGGGLGALARALGLQSGLSARGGGPKIGLRLELDARQYQELARLLAEFPKEAPRAAMRAVNAAARYARTVAKRAIANNLGLKQSDLVPKPGERFHREGGIRVLDAGPEDLVAYINIKGRRLPVIRFRPRPSKPVPEQKRGKVGVSYQIGIRGRRVQAHSFIARMKSGHVGVFMRAPRQRNVNLGRRIENFLRGTDTRRGKLYQLFGPSIPQVAEHDAELRQALDVDVTERLHDRLASQLDLLLTRKREQSEQPAQPAAEPAATPE